MPTLQATGWTDYELLDFGNGRKLERFGDVILDRPESNASGLPRLSVVDWGQMAHAKYDGPETGKGAWKKASGMQEHWRITYQPECIGVELFLSPYKHVGIFPEQYLNWQYLSENLSRLEQPALLNLFAYTGVASMVAAKAGAKVTHIDSSSSIMSRARTNFSHNQLRTIRTITDDAMKFVQREHRRGTIYNGIMLDPPAFGRSQGGRLWKLETHLSSLIESCKQVLNPETGFLILNTYSPALGPAQTEDLLRHSFGNHYRIETDWLGVTASDGRFLRLSLVNRVVPKKTGK